MNDKELLNAIGRIVKKEINEALEPIQNDLDFLKAKILSLINKTI